MRTFPLKNGTTVPALMLGTAEFGASIPEAVAFDLMDRYTDAGGTLADTANVYGRWVPGDASLSEQVIGRWLASRGSSRLAVATKGAHPRLTAGGMGPMRLAAEDILADCEESLRNLKADTVALYYLHRDDADRPVSEILDALEYLHRQGRIGAYAASNWTNERLAEADAYAKAHGLAGFTAVENQYSPAVLNPGFPTDRTLTVMQDTDVPVLQGLDLLPVAYSSQARGYFTKLAEGGPDALPKGTAAAYDCPVNRARLTAMQALSAETGLSVSQLALGCLTARGIAAVIGCRTAEQLSDSLTAADVALTPEQAGSVFGTV